MTDGQSEHFPGVRQFDRWLTALASLVVGSAFFALWFWLLPQWLGFQVQMMGMSRWRWLAALPSVLGFAVALRCIWDFGWTGGGTPSPFAPPQRLVVVGFYRYVRNPMYLGFAAVGSDCGSFSATPIQSPWRPSPRLHSACTCLWSFMRNRP